MGLVGAGPAGKSGKWEARPLQVASEASVVPGAVRGAHRRGTPREPFRDGQGKGYVQYEP